MKIKSFILRGAVLAIVSLLPQVHAEPRVPLPALPSMALGLYHNRFDEAYWFGKQRSETVQTEAGTVVESWSGYALQRAGNNVTPFVVPAVGERGQLNVACDFGSVGFWFKSYWSSGAVKSGSEPGVPARLVDLVVLGSQDAAVGWSLQVSADGNALVLVGANGERILGADIAWSAGEWHWIVLNYGTKGTALYVDDAWVAEGDVTMALPAGYSGLVLGSSVLGDETAGGEFEDFYCYRKPMTASQPSFGYAGMKKRTLAGVVTAEEVAALEKRRAERKALQEAQALLEPEGEGGGMMMRMMTPLSACVTNSPIYITNTACEFVTNQGWTVTFDVQGTNGPVDIFTTTNFLVGTNTQWTWLENGPTCATYQYTNQHAGQSFYILGTTNDTDSDGLTDAYEKLVSKTLVNDADTDNDGMPDGWEVNNGLNPLVNDSNDDPDGDWLTNLQEYNGGTNSTNPRDLMVVAWGLNTVGQCNVPLNLRNVKAIAAGDDFSLALRNDGTVFGWGANDAGQIDIPSDLTNAVAIIANFRHAVALRSDGTISMWGEWRHGTDYALYQPTDMTNVSAVAAGSSHDLAVRSNGNVTAWSPFTSTPFTTIPTNVISPKSIAAGYSHSVAVLGDGIVKAWGENFGPLGWNVTNVPVGLSNVASVVAGRYHSVALKSDGKITAWGAGSGNGFLFEFGQSIVPSWLSNVTAVAAAGFHSMALRKDGSVIAWGDMASPSFLQSNVTAIATGLGHGLGIRSGRQLPLILQSPVSRTELPGTNVTYTSLGLGLAEVRYQWQFNSANITGQTNATLTVNTISTNDEGSYTVVISTGAGSITSSVATLTLIGPPVITNTTPNAPSTNWLISGTNALFTMTVNATALETGRYPIRYQWFTNGVAVPGATNVNYYIFQSSLPWVPLWQTNPADADYSVKVWNPVGTNQTAAWTIRVISTNKAGGTLAWGNNSDGQIEYPALTNTLSIAAGELHSVAVKENGSVVQWGNNWASVPTNLTNAIAVAAGYEHSLALRSDGTVTTWGQGDANWTPINLAAVTAIAAGWNHNLALLTNGTVTAWGYGNLALGYTMTNVPAGLSNVTMISAGGLHSVVLKSDGTVVSWGYNGSGETNVPSGLSNVVAVAAGGQHSLALKSDGTIVGWGYNNSGQCTPPAGLSNVMAIAAGWRHSVALKNDGTVICWGANSSGQTNTPSVLSNVKMIAAGGDHTMAAVYSPLVQYPVDVSKDLLLIYNTNSVNSIIVKDYYLANRPMVSGANVLGIYYNTNEWPTYPGRGLTSDVNLTNQVLLPYLNWLNQNPTKRPQYIIWFYDLPVQVYNDPTNFYSPSYYLHTAAPGIKPFVTCINMRTTNDCKAYIDKLRDFGTNYSPGQLFISASKGGYGNTNYVVDNVREFSYASTEAGSYVFSATNGLLGAGVSLSNIFYSGTNQPCLAFNTNGVCTSQLQLPQQQITNATDVAGYISWGVHSSWLGAHYATDSKVKWTGNSSWWVIETVESYNGQRDNPNSGQRGVLDWYSANAFGGTNYNNTPVGAVTHVEEPNLPGINNSAKYFGFWASGKCFGSAAWNSRNTSYFQAVGDPFVKR